MKLSEDKSTEKSAAGLEAKARALIADPQFLYKAGRKVEELGVVGEERNRMILFLAGVTRGFEEPVSVMAKGPTASGKSNLMERVVTIFPQECVVERAGLSGKALAYGEGSLASKILLINEYRCGKDAQQLLRLLQSQRQIRHEATTVRGARRGTTTVERSGTPVVLTTTTDERVFADDETRFLSIWVDESSTQTLAILTAQAGRPKHIDHRDLQLWRKALSMLIPGRYDFNNPPAWLVYIAEQLPCKKMRVRRDWSRFLTFLKAATLCRRVPGHAEPLDIGFADYCVAYRILEPVLASTLRGLPTQEVSVAQAVAALAKKLERSVTYREVAERLAWKQSVVYKHVKGAARHHLIDFEPGTRERNVKRLLPRDRATTHFLPDPQSVLDNNSEIGTKVTFVDPFTGKTKTLLRQHD